MLHDGLPVSQYDAPKLQDCSSTSTFRAAHNVGQLLRPAAPSPAKAYSCSTLRLHYSLHNNCLQFTNAYSGKKAPFIRCSRATCDQLDSSWQPPRHRLLMHDTFSFPKYEKSWFQQTYPILDFELVIRRQLDY